MKDYLAGSVVPINGKDMRLTQPPTLADVIFYLQGQKQFKSEDFEAWRNRVTDGADKARAKLAQHGISPESIGSDKPSEGRLQLAPEGPVYVPHSQSSGDVGAQRFDGVDQDGMAAEAVEAAEAAEAAEAQAGLRKRRIGRLKLALMEARKVNADDWAEIITLSEETGLSIDVIELEKDLIKERMAEKKFMAGFDLDELHDSYPATAEFLSDFDNARFAHPKIDQLKEIEKGLAEGRRPNDNDALSFAEQRFDTFVKSRPDIMARLTPAEPAPFAAPAQPIADMGLTSAAPDLGVPDIEQPSLEAAKPEPLAATDTPDPYEPVAAKDDDGAFGA